MLINRTNIKLMSGTLMSVLIAAIFSTAAFAQATVDQVTQEGEKRADAGAAEQQRIEQVANQTDALLSDYKTVTKVVDGLLVYNGLLQRQVDNQEAEKVALAESIDNVALIERQIVPMMTRMIDSLEVFIQLDTPFLMKERTERVDRLVLEYSKQVAISVRYDELTDMITFDHLVPFHPIYERNYEFYGPDGSFDGLEFSDGIWIYQDDIDARNLD